MVNHTTISGKALKDGRTTRHQVESKDHHRLVKRGGADVPKKHEMKVLKPSNKYGNTKDKVSELKGPAATSAYRDDMTAYLLIGAFGLAVLYSSMAV